MNPDPPGHEHPAPDPFAVLDAALLEDDEPGTPTNPAPAAGHEQPKPKVSGPAAPATRHADVHAFVRDHLAGMWSRLVRDPDSTFRWCPRWAEHPAALDRLTALWQAWEALQAEGGTGPSRWWVEHADPTLVALTDPRGQFAQCGPDRHQQPPDLPLADPPAPERAAA